MNNETNSGFEHISLKRWRQFDRIDIDLHPRLTILTGANGSGKSTILSILEGNLIGGNHDHYLATPVEGKLDQKTRFSFSTLFSRLNLFPKSTLSVASDDVKEQIGEIELGKSKLIKISLPPPDQIQYQLQFSDSPQITGFKIGSHRPAPKYQHVTDIPISGIAPKEAFDFFRESSTKYEVGTRMVRGNTTITNPISPLKQTLISFAMHGSSNKNVRAVPEIVGLFDDFQETLRNVLPKEIGFRKLEVRPPEVLVLTDTGDFPIDGSSGGLMSLIQTSWQIFLFTKANKGKCVVLMDEPENHLHPSLQREFLSQIIDVFHSVQFVVATHSPFIISSVKDSHVYALRYRQLFDEDSRSENDSYAVSSTKIDLNKSAVTASQILDEVLGVSVTMPVWAENELKQIVNRFDREEIDEKAMKQLRADLQSAGLAEFLPQAITRLLS